MVLKKLAALHSGRSARCFGACMLGAQAKPCTQRTGASIDLERHTPLTSEQKQTSADQVSATGTVARNTAYLTGALVIQKGIAFVYFTLIARLIGTGNTGEYIWPLAFSTMFSILADFGLSPVLIREVARAKDMASVYLRNVLTVKLLFAAIAYGAMIAGLYFVDSYVVYLGFQSLNKSLVLVAGIVMLLDSFTLSFYAIFRGFQKLQYEAVGSMVNKVIVAVVGIIAVKMGLSVIFLLLAILVGSIFNVFFAGTMLVIKQKIIPRLGFNKNILKFLLRIALPFAIAAFFVNVYANFDTVMLRVRVGEGHAGWYTVAYKLTFALQFIPAAFAAAIFPAMSEYYARAREKLANIFERSMAYLMFVAIPLAVGLFVLADFIVLTMYTEAFEASIRPFRIFMGALVVIFLNYPVGYILNACNKQTVNTVNMGIAMVINIALNIVLIPKYTFNGAAVAALVSSWVLFLLGLFWVRTITPYRRWYLLKVFLKTFFAAGTMGMLVWLLKGSIGSITSFMPLEGGKLDLFNIVLLTVIGGLWYFFVMLAVRGFTLHDFAAIKGALFGRLRRGKIQKEGV